MKDLMVTLTGEPRRDRRAQKMAKFRLMIERMARRARWLYDLRSNIEALDADRRRYLGPLLDMDPRGMMGNLTIYSPEPRGFTDVRKELLGWADHVSLNAEGWEYFHQRSGSEESKFAEIEAAVVKATKKIIDNE